MVGPLKNITDNQQYRLIIVMTLFVSATIIIASKLFKKSFAIPDNMSSTYLNGLNETQWQNSFTCVESMNSMGITNKYAQAALLAVISKESNFIPQTEKSYSSSKNKRIRSIFAKTKSLSDSALTKLKKNPQAFFNYVYGGRYGNNTTGDGYKYRGRGFNQLTFKGNYAAIASKIGVDIVSNPDAVNRVDVAALVFCAYYKSRFAESASAIKKIYGADDINDFKDINTAAVAMFHANAGFGKTSSQIAADPTGGLAKTKSRAPGFYSVINQA